MRESGRDKAQVARLLQQMEARGWVRRSGDAVDRRVQRLEATEAGQTLHARMRAVRDAEARALLGRLTLAEQAELARLLARLLGD